MTDNFIRFLEKKIGKLKVELLDNKDRINALIDHDLLQLKSDTLGKLITEKGRLNKRASQYLGIIKNIMNVKLSMLNDQYNDRLSYHDLLMEQFAAEIQNHKKSFNHEHPLFGYGPFHEILLEMYTNKEEYEQCATVLNTIMNKNKQNRGEEQDD